MQAQRLTIDWLAKPNKKMQVLKDLHFLFNINKTMIIKEIFIKNKLNDIKFCYSINHLCAIVKVVFELSA